MKEGEAIRAERTDARERSADAEREGDEVPNAEQFKLVGSLRTAILQDQWADRGLLPILVAASKPGGPGRVADG